MPGFYEALCSKCILLLWLPRGSQCPKAQMWWYGWGQSQGWSMEEREEYEKRNGCVSVLGQAAMGTLSLMQTLAVLDSHRRHLQMNRLNGITSSWSLHSAAVVPCPPELPVSLPLASTMWPEQVSFQWDPILYPATFQAHLKYLPAP